MTWHDDAENYRAVKAGRTSRGIPALTKKTIEQVQCAADIAFKKWPGYPAIKLKKGLTHYGVLFTPKRI